MVTHSSSSSPNSVASGGSSKFRVRRRNGDRRVQCSCEMRAGIFSTSKPGNNYGRRFYGCENWKRQDPSRGSCKFFRWFDPITQSPEMLQQERDALEQELKFIEQEFLAKNDEFVNASRERDELKIEVQLVLKEMENVVKTKNSELNKLMVANRTMGTTIGVLNKVVLMLVVLLVVMVWICNKKSCMDYGM